MWSPNSTTKASAANSDNKKKEEVEDCRCSSGSDSTSATVLDAATPKEQQLNVFTDNNSKKQSSTFGANLTATPADHHNESAQQKEKEDCHSANALDSGFISGPQTSSSDIFEGDSELHNKPTSQYNISSQQQSSSADQHKSSASCSTVLDSGCIDEVLDDYDENEEEVVGKDITATEAEEKGSIATATTTTANKQQASGTQGNQMILKENVDAGMSEWFCKISLQNNETPNNAQQQLQQQPQQVAGIGMNNLDATAAGHRLTASSQNNTNSSFNQNSNRQQQAAGNSATTTATSTPPIQITPSNAWEQFYQQNDDGDTHLHLACISGYVDVVAALIRMAPHPCLFNIQNDEAQTPLHLAVLTVQPKILRMLLIAGAEPTLRDRHGNTALHLACIAGEEQCVRALTIPISASEINEAHRLYGHRSNDKTVSYLNCARLPSDLEIRNYDGERCVHLAAQAGHIEILRILVLYGADINAREGKSGRTPLHIAIEACNEDLANFLLDECQKLNLETATYAGLTAYQVACILNKSQMQNILERRGAEPLTPPDSDYDSDIESDLDDSKIYDRFGDPGYFISYNGGNTMTVA